jgi:predicted AAA+ superfamily ATPase
VDKIDMYSRLIKPRLLEAQQDTPVTLLAGPRQAGKTTLVKQISVEQGMKYMTLDDQLTLLSAKNDPVGMIRDIDKVVIDEIQRAPELLLAIKKSVDEDRRPGRFLLTGSANLMAMPKVADSLAGRMETLSLLPLSQSEIELQTANWIDNAFKGHILEAAQLSVGAELIDRVLKGGYPESVARETSRRRAKWSQQYIDAIIQRDVRDIANIDKLDQLPRFLSALCQTVGQMCNYSKLGGQVVLDGKTTSRYIGIFEQMYLLKRIDVWSRNRLSRVVKTPKLQFIDSGLLSSLLDLTTDEIQQDKTRFGNVLETFVYGELLKHATHSDGNYRIMYYRDADKVEVDFVIENTKGDIVGVEVKASATVTDKDLKGLKKLAGLAGKRFKTGLLLYDGTETMPLGENIWAAPLSSLWGK